MERGGGSLTSRTSRRSSRASCRGLRMDDTLRSRVQDPRRHRDARRAGLIDHESSPAACLSSRAIVWFHRLARPKGNPGPGGWGAIVVTPDQHVTELGGGSPHTNNKMELSGAIAALQHHMANQPGPVAIYTDSTYVIQGITQWVWGWRKRGWKTAQGGDVLNRDLWEQLSSLVGARVRGDVDWHWVRGHVGTRATSAPIRFRSPLPSSNRRTYASGRSTATRSRFSSCRTTPLSRHAAGLVAAGTTVAAYSCPLSVVGGVPMRHVSWAECEGRVKDSPARASGRPRARPTDPRSCAAGGSIRG